MDDRFRLVFRGEVLEGQHAAVVQKRIAEALKLDDEKSAILFSGKVVVLRRDADEKTASRYQALFQKAGARLRLLPVENPSSEAAGGDSSTVDASARDLSADEEAAHTAPVSRDGLSDSGFSVSTDYVAPPSAPAVEIDAPDFDVADPGALLGEPRRTVAADIPEVSFDLAEPGADLGSKKHVQPVVDLAHVHFDVAEIGADLGELRKKVAAVDPDISHLKLVDA